METSKSTGQAPEFNHMFELNVEQTSEQVILRLFHDAIAGPLSIGFSFLPVAALMLNLGEKRKFEMLNNN